MSWYSESLMQTVTVDVVCVVTFIVHTSYFFCSFLLGRGICGIPSTSFCSVAIPLIFYFSMIVPGFLRCLIRWFCRSNAFTVTTIWKDTGILEEIINFNFLFLLVGCYRKWWAFPFVFRRTSFCRHLSVCCLIGFLLPFFEFPVTGSIESNVSSLSLLRWYLLFSTVFLIFFHSVRCSILLVVFGHLERLF